MQEDEVHKNIIPTRGAISLGLELTMGWVLVGGALRAAFLSVVPWVAADARTLCCRGELKLRRGGNDL